MPPSLVFPVLFLQVDVGSGGLSGNFPLPCVVLPPPEISLSLPIIRRYIADKSRLNNLAGATTPKMRFKRSALLLPLILCLQVLHASGVKQESASANTGIPFIRNYLPEEYRAHGQNWAIIQDKNGFMYFGNTNGVVLQYDGVSWRQIPVANGSIARSLAMDSSGVIYVGAQNEIGYLAPDSVGNLRYISLISNIEPSYRNFGDVWQIYITADHAYFSTRKYLFRWDFSGTFKTWQAKTVFQSAFLLPGKELFIHQMQIGLMRLEADSLILIPGGERFNDDWVYVVTPAGEKRLLIGARKTGLFIFDGKRVKKYETVINQWLITNQVYHGITLRDGSHVFTTVRGGAAILDKNGDLLTVLDKSRGLQDENVWFAYQDLAGSLWLAMNKGLAHVEYPASFSLFDERSGLKGNVHDIVRHNGMLYAAAGLGVFLLRPGRSAIAKNNFEQLPGLNSQCWSLLSMDNMLLVSSNHGIYEIKDDGFTFIVRKSGWILSRSKKDSNRVYIGLDAGVASLYRSKDGWTDEGKLPGIEVEARTVAEDSLGRLWIGAVYEGVLRVDWEQTKVSGAGRLAPIVRRYNTTNGLPSRKYNLVFNNGRDVLFGTTRGVYRFDHENDYFLPVNFANQTVDVPHDSTSYTILTVDDDQNLWFNKGKKLALARYAGNNLYELEYRTFLPAPDASIYTIYPEAGGVVYFGGTKGVFRYQPTVAVDHSPFFRSHIRRVQVNNDSVIYGGARSLNYEDPILPYRQNALRFEYAAACYTDESVNTYQYMLEGFDAGWSNWTTETQKDYTNIPEGEYIFRIRAKNVYQNISDEAIFKFQILPPWYRTWWAYLAYLFFVSISLFFLIRILMDRTRRKAIAEQKRMERLRSKIAADLHDDIGAGLTEIAIMGEVISQKLDQRSKKLVGRELRSIGNTSRGLIDSMSDIVWLVNPRRDSLFDLVSRLGNSYTELLNARGIHFKIENLEILKNIQLEMEYRQHLFLIFKEAINNSLKYSNASEIFLNAFLSGKRIKMQLFDNGKGFDPNEPTLGNGVKNMKERAERIGGALLIKSGIGEGTMVEFEGRIT